MKKKMLALCLLVMLIAPIILLAQSNIVQPANAYASPPIIPIPSTPEFTVKYIDNSWDTPTMVVTIKNQPLPSLLNGSYHMYFNVRVKSHSENNWNNLYSSNDFGSGSLPLESLSGDTTLSYSQTIPLGNRLYHNGDQVDIQVEAIIGINLFQEPLMPDLSYFYSATSGWSPTETLNLFDPPQISVLSPKAGNYNVSDVPLNFVVNNPVSQIAYSLDGQENITVPIIGNTILSGLPNGNHDITIYVNDTYGNSGKSETINFTITVSKPTQTESFPTALVVGSIIAVAVVVSGLLVYFKKRKGSLNP